MTRFLVDRKLVLADMRRDMWRLRNLRNYLRKLRICVLHLRALLRKYLRKLRICVLHLRALLRKPYMFGSEGAQYACASCALRKYLRNYLRNLRICVLHLAQVFAQLLAQLAHMCFAPARAFAQVLAQVAHTCFAPARAFAQAI